MSEDVVNGEFIRTTYYSLDEFADAAERRVGLGPGKSRVIGYKDSWAGGSWAQALNYARNGWHEQLDTALQLAEDAIEMADKEQELMAFQPIYDVAGSDVDMGRFMSGDPECMIDYPLTVTSKVGRVITLCVGGFYSASMRADALIRRGTVITALAMALTRLGHATELWLDVAVSDVQYSDYSKHEGSVRVLVKGPNDVVDPARILYAFAHPTVFRKLSRAVMNGWPAEFVRAMDVGSRYCHLGYIKRDLADGTIYLEGVTTSHNLPDVHEELRRYLRELGLLAE